MVEEAESRALAREIDESAPDLVSCWLLVTELRRAAVRRPDLDQIRITDLLDAIDLVEMPASLFGDAGLLPGESLRPLDALHIAAAIRAGVDELVTYDVRMARAAQGLGLRVSAPA